MVQEIGSEFWEAEINQLNKLAETDKYQYLLTGRTAIDYIIKDIKLSRDLNIVYLPTYCCHTMIQPFLDNGITVEYYEINFSDGKFTYDIDFNTRCDAILIMQYFGFYNETVGQIISKLNQLGKIIIEDATHSWLTDSPYNSNSDYVFASFRKWTGIPCGAVAIKKTGNFPIKLSDKTNYKYLQMRIQAAVLKKEFIEKQVGSKERFLALFNQAEGLLDQDYKNYSIPKEIKDTIKMLDFNKIKSKRKVNAEFLIQNLQNLPGLNTVESTKKDTPLFVPLFVKEGKRDSLRQYLINNNIYCPVHWPISHEHKFDNKYLFENGLSLVCDQRYSINNMNRIIETINRFYGG